MTHPRFLPSYTAAARRYRQAQHRRSFSRLRGVRALLGLVSDHPGESFQLALLVLAVAYMGWQILRFLSMPPLGQ